MLKRRGWYARDEPPLPEDSDVDEFFVEGSDHSTVKTTVATKYFFTWAETVSRKTRCNRIGYVVLYGGSILTRPNNKSHT